MHEKGGITRHLFQNDGTRIVGAAEQIPWWLCAANKHFPAILPMFPDKGLLSGTSGWQNNRMFFSS